MDFFNAVCQSGPFTQEKFGICDGQGGTPAYIDCNMQHATQWIATVENPSMLPAVFTAIDKCVILDTEEPGRERCDGMLTTGQLLYLVELKDQRKAWQTHAIEQLESTIQFLLAEHPEIAKRYRHKKAFACNKHHPRFATIDHDVQKRFYKTYGFRLDLQASVLLMD